MINVKPKKQGGFEETMQSTHLDTTCVSFRALQAYTIEGDEVQHGRFYSNKARPMGIIRASVDDAVR